MDKDDFVQKVKLLCIMKGIKPTNACKECGVGGSFLSDVSRGQIPSVNRVQALAKYLGVTTSELLGEDASEISQGPAQPYLVMRYNQLSQAGQEDVMTFLEYKVLQEKNAKKEDE